MFKKRHAQKRNLLTMVPLLDSRVTLGHDSSKGQILIVQRTNIVERFTIRVLKQPAVRKINLDKFGIFVIEQMQFSRTVQQISEAMEEHFGEEAEPTLPRLMKFLEILESQDWIKWEEDKKS